MGTVGFLHTADVHIPTFRALLSELAPAEKDVHVVDERLLADARIRGVDAEIEARLRALAEQGPAVIVCTCSTLSGAAERLTDQVGVSVMRVDRAATLAPR